MSSTSGEAKKYKPSDKRESTSRQLRQRIKDAAWSVFAEHGLDGATISQIVALSGCSTGSFYNRFGSKEAVFEEILSDALMDVRTTTAEARGNADTLEEMLRVSNKAFLESILSIEGAVPFIARNQHHIRAQFYGLDGTSGLIDDIRKDVLRGTAGMPLDYLQVSLIASLIVSNGIEILMLLGSGKADDIPSLVDLMTRVIVSGLSGMVLPEPEK